MTLEPRTVDPGFTKRWSRHALELVLRSFHSWFSLGLAMTALLYGASALWSPLVLPAGMFCVALSTSMARMSDLSTLSVESFGTAVRDAGLYAVRLVRERIVMLIAVLIVGDLIARALMSAVKDAPQVPAPDFSDPFTWLVGPQSPLVIAAAGLYVGAMFQSSSFGFAGLSYPLRRAFGLDYATAESLLMRANMKNREASMFLEAMLMGTMMVTVIFVPALVPFALCFVPALLYVAYREVFEHGNGNTAEVRQGATKTAALGAGA